MAFNGSGTFNRIYSWVTDKVNSVVVNATRMDAEMDGFATGLSNCVTKDGQTTITANLPMSGFIHTGVGNANARTNYAVVGQAQDGKYVWADGGGTADAITAIYDPPITVLVDGMILGVRATAANATTTPTFSPNGLTARTITKNGGSPLVAGDIVGDNHELLLRYYSASTRWELLSPRNSILTLNNTFSGTSTFSNDVTMSGANLKFAKEVVASASTVNLTSANGNFIHISGTTAITSFGSSVGGETYILKFNAALTLTHNATSLILPGGANIVTEPGDACIVTADDSSGNWRVISYTRDWGGAITHAPITASLGANVSLNNTSNYFDGPSIAQGTSGVWLVNGTVTLADSAGPALFDAKLWDGTTVIASAAASTYTANAYTTITLSGYITNPTGNVRVSVRDEVSTSGIIAYNRSGNSKDSCITAIRIG